MIRRRGLIGLAVATAAMTAAAVAVNLEQPGTATVELGARLLPGLAERIGDAAVISVRTARDAFTIRRDGDSWGMADRDGYPVRASAVRAALRCRAHRKRCQTTSQGLENAALRVGQTDAIAASRSLADAHRIACASAPNTRVCLADAAHDQYSDRLLGARSRDWPPGPSPIQNEFQEIGRF